MSHGHLRVGLDIGGADLLAGTAAGAAAGTSSATGRSR
jgi:hypothetical protein